ncbi:hypothetical protein ACFXPI_27585 [Streptomyces sp. NPDC059104]|uniref:hypothetical protein n=1 Tax=Streptomyces sp. NPDC059104 TaxID=3346729 RepID=UPI0036C9FB10
MLPKSKVDLHAAIRRDANAGSSLRALMRKYGVGYETVQKALISAFPEPRKKMVPRETRLDRYKPLIDGILTADLTAPCQEASASSTGRSTHGRQPANARSTRVSMSPTCTSPQVSASNNTSRT